MRWRIHCRTCGWQKHRAMIVGAGQELQRQALKADAEDLHRLLGRCSDAQIEVTLDATEAPSSYAC